MYSEGVGEIGDKRGEESLIPLFLLVLTIKCHTRCLSYIIHNTEDLVAVLLCVLLNVLLHAQLYVLLYLLAYALLYVPLSYNGTYDMVRTCA